MYFGVKGFCGGALEAVALPLFKEVYHVSLEQYHVLYVAARLLPWCLKPLVGILTNYVPLCGFQKKSYVILFAMLGIVCGVLGNVVMWSAVGMAWIFAGLSTAIMATDLLFEASYGEQMKVGLKVSGNLLPEGVWALVLIGSVIGSFIVGFLADDNIIRPIFIATSPVFLWLFIFAVKGYIPESRKVYSGELIKSQLGKIVLGLLLSMSAITSTVVMQSGDPRNHFTISVVLSVVIIYVAFQVLSPKLARINMFLFCSDALTLNLIGATEYFYTESCIGTPGFSYWFYKSLTALLASLFALLGIYCLSKIENWSVRSIVVFLTIAKCSLSSLEVAQATRLNIEWGIPDEVTYIFSEAVSFPVFGMMFFMTTFIMTTRCVERGSEVLTFALLAGFQNYATIVATSAGHYFIDAYQIKGCDFRNLPLALLIGHMVLPSSLVALAYILLPDEQLRVINIEQE